MRQGGSSSSYRDNQQRYHKGRQGSMLVPHGAPGGLLFTVNPRQEPRAVREAQIYLNGLTADLQKAHGAYLAKHEHNANNGNNFGDSSNGGGDEDVNDDDDDDDDDVNIATEKQQQQQPQASTSSLLAAELAEVMEDENNMRRKRRRDDNHDGDDGSDCDEGAGQKKKAKGTQVSPTQRWFASLDTSVKGYMLLNIPAINPAVTCIVCSGGGGGAAPSGGSEKPETTEGAVVDNTTTPTATTVVVPSTSNNATGIPSHAVMVNPIVSHVVERVFADLLGKNASPVFRHCFRMTPAEVTCCPTLPEMQSALKALLALHFPLPSSSAPDAAADNGSNDNDWMALDRPIPMAEPISHAATTTSGSDVDSGKQKKRHMFTVALTLNVKNNSNVEAKKSQFLSQLQAAIPMNRFIVLPATLLQKQAAMVDAALSIHVIHATCVMGIQRLYGERRGYNMHSLSEDTLELSNTVVGAGGPKESEHPPPPHP